jgi:predicted SnoaL-like aldol condensation-catalyzing enzyme
MVSRMAVASPTGCGGYRQHSSHLPGGRAGLEGLVRQLFPDGPLPVQAEPRFPPMILMAEDDIVTLAACLPQPDPDPSARYPLYVYDAYQVRDSKICGHWSGIDKNAPPQHWD